jgi:non-ribosomal peptide synthetase component F
MALRIHPRRLHVRAVVLSACREGWRTERAAPANPGEGPTLIVLEDRRWQGWHARSMPAARFLPHQRTRQPRRPRVHPYTPGSTGKPKGVMLSHRAAVAFVEWCSTAFSPRADDRFSSHAPFHFDLSILDLYVPLKHGATVVLIDADRGKEPIGLAQVIAERRLTVWYSTPTILSVLGEFGRMERTTIRAAAGVLCRRGLSREAPAGREGTPPATRVPQPVWPDRDQRLHLPSHP